MPASVPASASEAALEAALEAAPAVQEAPATDNLTASQAEELVTHVVELRKAGKKSSCKLYGWSIECSVRANAKAVDLCVVDPRDGQKLHSIISIQRKLGVAAASDAPLEARTEAAGEVPPPPQAASRPRAVGGEHATVFGDPDRASLPLLVRQRQEVQEVLRRRQVSARRPRRRRPRARARAPTRAL